MEYKKYLEFEKGILEIKTNENKVLSVLFVEDLKENSLNPPQILIEAYDQLSEYFKGTRKVFNLDLDIKGSDFRKKVFNTLLKIPYGKTISYKEEATMLGNEKASRAVGSANGKNIINIIIPCHRVIGANKKLVGYGGGLDKKAWLIEHEKKNL